MSNCCLTTTLWLFSEKKYSKVHPQVASAGEILSVFVEGNRHDTVCGVESLLHTIPVMDVNIYVENPLVVPGTTGKRRSYTF